MAWTTATAATNAGVRPVMHGTYNAADADFYIHVITKTHIVQIVELKVHKARLEAASPVFADMFAMISVTGHDDALSNVLSNTLSTEGKVSVWELLLQSVYNDSNAVPNLADVDLPDLVDLWKEAHKYNMVTLFTHAELCMVPLLSRWNSACIFRIYVDAIARQRNVLAYAARTVASRGRLKDFGPKLLATLPAPELAEFVHILYDADMARVETANNELRDVNWSSSKAEMWETIKVVREELSILY